MFYAKIKPIDVANGPYIRTTLFVSGCHRNCKNCHNKEAQAFDYGNKWTEAIEDDFFHKSSAHYVKGITILGGEPFEQTQDTDLIHLLKRLKTLHKPIWIYSGYTYEELIKNPKQKAILALCDVLVDGPFIEAQKDLTLYYRGSSNQRIIDIAKSLNQNTIILLDAYN